MLVSEANLQECVEMPNSTGTRNVKFLIRDIPSGIGSSGHSNYFLSLDYVVHTTTAGVHS